MSEQKVQIHTNHYDLMDEVIAPHMKKQANTEKMSDAAQEFFQKTGLQPSMVVPAAAMEDFHKKSQWFWLKGIFKKNQSFATAKEDEYRVLVDHYDFRVGPNNLWWQYHSLNNPIGMWFWFRFVPVTLLFLAICLVFSWWWLIAWAIVVFVVTAGDDRFALLSGEYDDDCFDFRSTLNDDQQSRLEYLKKHYQQFASLWERGSAEQQVLRLFPERIIPASSISSGVLMHYAEAKDGDSAQRKATVLDAGLSVHILVHPDTICLSGMSYDVQAADTNPPLMYTIINDYAIIFSGLAARKARTQEQIVADVIGEPDYKQEALNSALLSYQDAHVQLGQFTTAYQGVVAILAKKPFEEHSFVAIVGTLRDTWRYVMDNYQTFIVLQTVIANMPEASQKDTTIPLGAKKQQQLSPVEEAQALFNMNREVVGELCTILAALSGISSVDAQAPVKIVKLFDNLQKKIGSSTKELVTV